MCPLLNLPLCFAFPPLLSLFCWKLPPHKESILGQFKVSSEWLDSAKCTVPLCSKNSIERLFAERQHNAKLREENMGAATYFLLYSEMPDGGRHTLGEHQISEHSCQRLSKEVQFWFGIDIRIFISPLLPRLLFSTVRCSIPHPTQGSSPCPI